ncbi:hypothetical protein BASA81_008401 [Batrachochytrium salamandrivorans]|nr:hypothetical protein BASA81_008401 [Batrachochytrium salamandrivorans]
MSLSQKLSKLSSTPHAHSQAGSQSPVPTSQEDLNIIENFLRHHMFPETLESFLEEVQCNFRRTTSGENPSWTCIICDKVFTKKGSAKRHCDTAHLEETAAERVECPQCLQKFNRRDDLYSHIRRIHRESGGEDLVQSLIHNTNRRPSKRVKTAAPPAAAASAAGGAKVVAQVKVEDTALPVLALMPSPMMRHVHLLQPVEYVAAPSTSLFSPKRLPLYTSSSRPQSLDENERGGEEDGGEMHDDVDVDYHDDAEVHARHLQSSPSSSSMMMTPGGGAAMEINVSTPASLSSSPAASPLVAAAGSGDEDDAQYDGEWDKAYLADLDMVKGRYEEQDSWAEESLSDGAVDSFAASDLHFKSPHFEACAGLMYGVTLG